jgi:hypothetical protein
MGIYQLIDDPLFARMLETEIPRLCPGCEMIDLIINVRETIQATSDPEVGVM